MSNLSDYDKRFLDSYNPDEYEHPSVAVDVLIFTIGESGKLELLLIERRNPPFQGKWALPGGFVGMHEDLEYAVQRTLEREVGVHGLYTEQLYTFGQVERDPRTRVISVAYFALVPKSRISVLADNDASDVKWVPVNLAGNTLRVPSGIDFAFDHEYIVKTAIERIRGKLSYTDIALNLLNDQSKFTIFELQLIHEAILGMIVDTANFRRSFNSTYVKSGRAELTGEVCTNAHGRPSKYYRIKS